MRHCCHAFRDCSNYTLHKSVDGGALWEFVNRVYGDGAEYSDAHILPDGNGKGVLAFCAPREALLPRVPRAA